ncbi:hypothetical protein RB195_008702 [Necator americanus]|uniref:Uncharacterized protein n=1 Tax=Necator americanus TaxID=51031 RepID=A0ABR1CSG6_NECAM
MDIAVVLKFYAGSDHRLLLARFSFEEEKAVKFSVQSPRTIVNWDLFATLTSFWEDSTVDEMDEKYDQLVEHLHNCMRRPKTSKTTKKRLPPETPELIRRGELTTKQLCFL